MLWFKSHHYLEDNNYNSALVSSLAYVSYTTSISCILSQSNHWAVTRTFTRHYHALRRIIRMRVASSHWKARPKAPFVEVFEAAIHRTYSKDVFECAAGLRRPTSCAKDPSGHKIDAVRNCRRADVNSGCRRSSDRLRKGPRCWWSKRESRTPCINFSI